MDRFKILDALQAAHCRYFRLFLENYPQASDDTTFGDFGLPGLCDLAIEVHSCAIALGLKARERLFYLGLDLLYPFDNPVDLYNWRVRVRTECIDRTTYASIGIRIDAEFGRMRRVFELGGEDAYDAVPTDVFLVSKMRYKCMAVPDEGNSQCGQSNATGLSPGIHIDTVNIPYAADLHAVSRLERLEKETAIGANFSNIVSVLRSLISG